MPKEAQSFAALLATAAQPGAPAESRLEAFAQIVRRYQDMVFGCAYAVLGDVHSAEDAAQEAFLSAYRALPALRDHGAFPAWLRRIVMNQCHHQTRGRRLPLTSMDAAASMPTPEVAPPEAAARNELAERVLVAIGALSARQRMVTTLYYVNGYSQNEIAGFLDVSVSTVKKRLFDARRQLKERALTMVADQLNRSKPGPEFADRIRRMVGLIRQGERLEALRVQEATLGALNELARAGHHAQVVREHRAAMRLLAEIGPEPHIWCQTYGLYADSYVKTGSARELADGIASTIPEDPTPQDAAMWVAEQMIVLMDALRDAGDAQKAARVGRRVLELAQKAADAIEFEPWEEPPDGRRGSPIAIIDQKLRTGRTDEYFAKAQSLLDAGDLAAFSGCVNCFWGLPEVMLLGLPASPRVEEMPALLNRLHAIASALANQKRHPFAHRVIDRCLQTIEQIRDEAPYRFHRVHTLIIRAKIAVEQDDQGAAQRAKQKVLDELQAGERDLARACPGVSRHEDARDPEQLFWLQQLGRAYFQAIHSLEQLAGLIEPVDAYRLARRAAELHDEPYVHERLARWALSIDHDRAAALEHLRRAMAPGSEVVLTRANRYWFYNRPEYEAVRADAEFLALVGPPDPPDTFPQVE